MRDMVQAAVAEEGATTFDIREVSLRDVGPSDVKVEVDASAFCYSDWIALRGDMGLQANETLPAVLGHSAVGRVVEAGANTRTPVGSRVVITATPECGNCYWCKRGRIDQCSGLFVQTPVLGTLNDGRNVFAPGSSATYSEMTVLRDTQVWEIESDLPDEWLAMMGCGMVSGMGAVVNVGRVTPGDAVLVVGCGQIGLWMIQAARVLGAEIIIASDPIAERRELAKQLGATHLIDPTQVSTVETVRDLTEGRGADVGFDAGGSTGAVEDAFLGTRNGGVTVLTTYVTRDTKVSLPLFDLALRGRDVRSSQSGRIDMRRDLAQFLPWLSDGLVNANAMLGNIRPLEQINDTLVAARDRTEITPIVRLNG